MNTTLERETDIEAPDLEAIAELEEEHGPALEWLEGEFPEWEFSLDMATTSNGDVILWIASQDDHHPQSELSPAKLQRRLTEYMDRYLFRQGLKGDDVEKATIIEEEAEAEEADVDG